MSFTHEITTVYASVNHQIHPSASAIPQYAQGVTITVQNLSGGNYIYLGNDNTSSVSYGFRLSPNQAISFDLNPFDNLHAISNDGSTQVAITRLYW